MKAWLDFLKSSIGDEAAIESLRRWMGQLLCSLGWSGKSVLLEVLSQLVLSREWAVVRGLMRNRYYRDAALLIIDGGMSNKMELRSLLKQILDGDKMVSPRRGRDPEFFFPHCAVAVADNINSSVAFGCAVWRRVLPIEMRTPCERDRADVFLFEKLCEELPAIHDWAVAPAVPAPHSILPSC